MSCSRWACLEIARDGLFPLVLVVSTALAGGLLSGCDDTETLGVAVRDGNELRLVDARGQITEDGTAIVVTVTGWSNPSCSVIDDEVSVTATLRVVDPSAVTVGAPIDIGPASAPVTASLSMGSMGRICSQDCENPVFTLTGTVTFDELSATRACGSIDLSLVGDIPASGDTGQSYQRQSSLTLTWHDFCAPMDIDHCH